VRAPPVAARRRRPVALPAVPGRVGRALRTACPAAPGWPSRRSPPPACGQPPRAGRPVPSHSRLLALVGRRPPELGAAHSLPQEGAGLPLDGGPAAPGEGRGGQLPGVVLVAPCRAVHSGVPLPCGLVGNVLGWFDLHVCRGEQHRAEYRGYPKGHRVGPRRHRRGDRLARRGLCQPQGAARRYRPGVVLCPPIKLFFAERRRLFGPLPSPPTPRYEKSFHRRAVRTSASSENEQRVAQKGASPSRRGNPGACRKLL
jgi:hypothetical protein